MYGTACYCFCRSGFVEVKEKELSDLVTSLDTYITLDTLITLTRQNFNATASKYELQKTIVPIYENAIEVSMLLYENTGNPDYKEVAYDFISRNKAIILIEGLQDEKVKYADIPSDLLKEEAKLKRAYYDTETLVNQNIFSEDTTFLSDLQDSLFVLKRDYERLIKSFEQDYPAYYHHKYDYYSELTVSDIQTKIEKDRAVIEFFIGENNLFVTVIAKNHFEIYKSNLPDNFRDTCYDFIGMARGEQLLKEEEFTNAAFSLYKILLEAPLNDLEASINRLQIIPDDILLQLPYDVLLTKPYSIDVESWHNENIPYLIRKYSTSQVYARSLLFDVEGENKIIKSQKEFAGFGIEYFDFTKKGLSQTEDTLSSERIHGRLIYSDDEVLAIQKIIGGDAFINEDATKTEFLNTANEYRILHFATHGFADEKSPLNSALVFAKLNETNDKDWLLRASDLYSMDLNASLVVLSACQTNYGRIQKGEGMRTLSRGFSYAGTKALVASLWNISDLSSKEIFTRFYDNIKENKSKDVALQEAKLSYLKNVDDINKALPHRWAQTIVIGDVAPLEFNTISLGQFALILLAIVSLIFMFFKMKRF